MGEVDDDDKISLDSDGYPRALATSLEDEANKLAGQPYDVNKDGRFLKRKAEDDGAEKKSCEVETASFGTVKMSCYSQTSSQKSYIQFWDESDSKWRSLVNIQNWQSPGKDSKAVAMHLLDWIVESGPGLTKDDVMEERNRIFKQACPDDDEDKEEEEDSHDIDEDDQDED